MSEAPKPTGNALRGLLDPEAWLRLQEEKAQADRAAAEAAGVCLGAGASDRAYELVALGLLYEERIRSEFLRAREEVQKPRRGAPTKAIGKDEARAMMLRNLWAGGYVTGSVLNMIHTIRRSEERYLREGHLERSDCLFAGGTDTNLQASVSRGWKILGLSAKDLR